jgi:hypothetical protein
MRVQITTRLHGTLDGIDLTRFEVGRIYDIGSSLANYLLASGYAVPVTDERADPMALDDDEGTDRERHS